MISYQFAAIGREEWWGDYYEPISTPANLGSWREGVAGWSATATPLPPVVKPDFAERGRYDFAASILVTGETA